MEDNAVEGPSGRSSSLGKRSRSDVGSSGLDGQDEEMEEQDGDAEMEGFVDEIAEGLELSYEEEDEESNDELMPDMESFREGGKKPKLSYIR